MGGTGELDWIYMITVFFQNYLSKKTMTVTIVLHAMATTCSCAFFEFLCSKAAMYFKQWSLASEHTSRLWITLNISLWEKRSVIKPRNCFLLTFITTHNLLDDFLEFLLFKYFKRPGDIYQLTQNFSSGFTLYFFSLLLSNMTCLSF